MAPLQLDAESLRRTSFPPDLAEATEATHEHRVVGQRLGTIDDPAQELVIAGAGDAEGLADRPFLGDLQAPGIALEVEDRPFSFIKPERLGCR